VASVVVAGIAALLWLPLGSPATPTNGTTDSTTLDSTSIGVVGSGDSVPIVGPPTPTGGSPAPKVTVPGKGNTTSTPGVRPSNLGTIIVRAPADARVFVRDNEIGFGDSRRDSLSPGPHAVRAVLPAIEGCDAARATTIVNVRAGGLHQVTLTPKLCGTLEINVVATRNGQPVTATVWYSLQPEGADFPRDIPLTPGPRVLPVGKWTLRVRIAGCSDYTDTFEILAGEPQKVQIRPLC
jgi:hypothetical protein